MDQEKEECVSDTQQWMNKAFDIAELALSNGEVPVGCVFVCRNDVIADGANTVNRTKNATRHAEMNCIDMVMRSCKIADVDWRKVFPEVEVFVTVEPCIMCCSALSSLHVKRVTYGCDNFRFGGCGSVLDVPQLTDNPLVTVSGVQKDRAIALLKQFYQGSNPNAPPSKIAKKEARLERRAIREKQDCEDIHSKTESAMNCPVPDKSNNTGQSNHIVN
ncbi:tRNA-specific adenosine deaminase 2 [Schistocerca nitens]|uniref:tRNA-specific adenosine deaminase 2 n=1 Tax=Schistocerca nitens TaxID=7011 RepID=UPI002119421E|nr:tRNA-specific adenosine deaminase 2 [Schistocerca nitens]